MLRNTLLATGMIALLGAGAITFTSTRTEALTAWNTGCRHILVELKTKPIHRAFATGMGLEEQYCMSIWGKASKEAAIAEVLVRCKSYSGHPCTVEYAE